MLLVVLLPFGREAVKTGRVSDSDLPNSLNPVLADRAEPLIIWSDPPFAIDDSVYPFSTPKKPTFWSPKNSE